MSQSGGTPHREVPDDDAITRARAVLLRTGRKDQRKLVEAYRVLAAVHPLSYLPQLVESLLMLSYQTGRIRADLALELTAEAAAAVRRIGDTEPCQPELSVRALKAHAGNLQSAGRRAEALDVLEELHEYVRSAFASGRHPDIGDGSPKWATALSEHGRHSEAAEVLGRVVESQRHLLPWYPGYDWDRIAWCSELEAAGDLDAALDVHQEFITLRLDRREPQNEAHTSDLHLAVRHAQLLASAGRVAECREAWTGALDVCSRLAAANDDSDRPRFNDSCLNILFLCSSRPFEPAVPDGEIAPALGAYWWGGGVAQRFAAQAEVLLAELGGRLPVAEADPSTHAADLVVLYRRALVRQWCNLHLKNSAWADLKPALDSQVELARLAYRHDAARGPGLLAQALVDRAQFAAAVQQYTAALADFTEALSVLDAPDSAPASAPASAPDRA